ncbi:MAG: thiamine pyrophosphate-binding protein [Oscillospiraceae bacterium]
MEGNFGQIKRVAKALADCEKPVICVGGGVFFAKAADEVLRLSQKLRIPVVSTMMGLGAVPGGYDLFLGMMGMHGVAAANLAIREADLLLIVGARIGDRAVNSPDAIANNTKIVHIDIDPAEIGKNVGVHIPLVGDAKNALSRLAGRWRSSTFEWSAQAVSRKKTGAFSKENGVNPKRFMAMFSNAAPEDTILVADVGQNQIWSANYFQVKKGRFLTSGGMGTMGYSVPAAMGAKCSRPDAPVFAVCGDGSFQMQMMELATIVQHQIPVKIVLMQNARLGMVRELQTNQYHGNCTAVFLDGSPDFLKLAEAYGIPASRVVSDAEIPQALKRCLQRRDRTFWYATWTPEKLRYRACRPGVWHG